MTITRKWIFIFKGSLSCHPGLLKAFRPFTAMPQKSIAIYSPFGPQATKVNNTVTSSLTAEHGHKTALPLKYNLTQLFIYARTADCVGFHRGQILQQSHTKRSSSYTSARRNAGPWIRKASWHPPKLPASMMSISWKKDEKSYFFKVIKAEGGNTRSNMSYVYSFFLWNFLKNCQVPDATSQTIIFCS